jgi:protein-tyrosine-phosphatase
VVTGTSGRPIQSVLFMCSQNAVRSPMAEAMAKHFFGKSLYVQSAGVNKSEADPFITAVMDEYGIDTAKHKPKTIDELEEWEGLNFDLVVTLSPEAHHRALDLTRSLSMDVEYWPTPDPTVTQGSRDQMLDAYRSVRDMLSKKIKARLAP